MNTVRVITILHSDSVRGLLHCPRKGPFVKGPARLCPYALIGE
jgi:hypothetical protein